jgi:hypothetical protein
MDSMMWLRLIFAVIFFGGTWVGFAILFCAFVDEETRRQAQAVRAAIRAGRKKASEARRKALKRAWHDRRDQLFAELGKASKKSSLYPVISKEIADHLANKP